LVIAGLSAVICLIVSIVLIPRIGIVGGAIGTAISYLLTQVTVMLYFKKITGVPLSQLYLLQKTDIDAYRTWSRSAMRRLRQNHSAP